MTSMRRNDVASTSFRRHVPTRFFINQCQIIIFLILKSDIIENSRIELREIVLPEPSNQIKVAFIILPFNLVYLWFFPVSHRNWRKWWVDNWGGQRVCWPPLSNYWGGLAPPGPPSSYAYEKDYTLCALISHTKISLQIVTTAHCLPFSLCFRIFINQRLVLQRWKGGHAGWSESPVYIHNGVCSCKANKLNNRQCLFFRFLWLRYRLSSFHNVHFFLYFVRHNIFINKFWVKIHKMLVSQDNYEWKD